MLKYFIFLIFMIPLIYNFWLMMSMMLILCFLMLFINMSMNLNFMGFFMGIDMISLLLIILSLWISSLMFLASKNIKINNNYEFKFCFMIILLMIFLFLSFSINNLFLFYFFFESSLIPTMILIFGWGYQPERLNSGYYLLFYTLLASLPLLMSIFYLYKLNGSCMIMIILNSYNSILLYLGLILAFLVKLPMFMFHFWLPKAHVEAPISGSMILAGILLKLGGYGLLRMVMYCEEMFNYLSFFWISISLYGSLIISLICLFQSDVKSLIAYSSVSHMSLVLMGIMTMFTWGFNGALIMMIGHGLCSSGLFCLSNIMYERLSTRSFFISKGMMSFMPSMSLLWFMFCSCNMASPPSINLLSEIMIINSLISWSYFSIFFLMMTSFFSACYSFYLFAYTQHGNFYSGYYSFSSGFIQEYLLLFLHWIPLNFLILKSEFLMI
uniref:NADH dehydrogenase subunit 4 n=1 Tax=Philagra albinotata TaxID=868271 RepID=UPI002551D9B2|nr:NADH dehydrogenase subunit 4 [Philagra albinotata]WGL39478.1 NADH dehydrogenase subunit 4 [Philagra albinotata]